MAASAPAIEERAKGEGGACLESYRVDVTARAWPILVPAAILTTIGAVLICTAFVAQGVLQHRPELTFAGAACMAFGPLLAAYGMRHILAHDDDYLALLERGVLIHVGEAQEFVRWSELSRVRWDASTRAIVFERRDAQAIALARTFARLPADALAAHIDELRRKAGFNLLR
jgi:hypothetical protein